MFLSHILGTEKVKIEKLKEHPEFIPTLAEWHYSEWSYLHAVDSVERRISELEEEAQADGIPQTFVALSGDTLLGSASLISHGINIVGIRQKTRVKNKV